VEALSGEFNSQAVANKLWVIVECAWGLWRGGRMRDERISSRCMLHALEICENGEEAKVAGECWRCEQTHQINNNSFVPKLLKYKKFTSRLSKGNCKENGFHSLCTVLFFLKLDKKSHVHLQAVHLRGIFLFMQ
jgi:hypothetical protein